MHKDSVIYSYDRIFSDIIDNFLLFEWENDCRTISEMSQREHVKLHVFSFTVKIKKKEKKSPEYVTVVEFEWYEWEGELIEKEGHEVK